jgi:anti-sigma B factor antagonist
MSQGPRRHLRLENVDGVTVVSFVESKIVTEEGAVKGKLKLCCIHPDLLEVFRITRLDQVFEIYSDEQAALDKFS